MSFLNKPELNSNCWTEHQTCSGSHLKAPQKVYNSSETITHVFIGCCCFFKILSRSAVCNSATFSRTDAVKQARTSESVFTALTRSMSQSCENESDRVEAQTELQSEPASRVPRPSVRPSGRGSHCLVCPTDQWCFCLENKQTIKS